MNRKSKSFRQKLWLCFALFAVIIFTLLWLLQTVFLQTIYNGMLTTNTHAAAKKIAAGSQREDLTELIDQLCAENSLLVFITDYDGKNLYSADSYQSYYRKSSGKSGSDNPYHQGETLNWQIGSYRNLPDGYTEFLNKLSASETGVIEYSTETQYVYGADITLQDGAKAALYVSTAFGAVGAAATIIRVQLMIVTLLSLGIAFLIAFFFAKRFEKPITQLNEKAKHLESENTQPAPRKSFCRELDELNASLDSTAQRLREANEYQKELLANVSHDLRTPLTMIEGYAEMLRDVSWSDEQQREADISVIIKESQRLTALVNEIMEYSRLQETGLQIETEPLDFSALVNRVADRFEPVFSYNGGTIERQIDKNITVNGNAVLLERLVYNLTDNAIRHTGESKKNNRQARWQTVGNH